MIALDVTLISGKKMTINLQYLISFGDGGHYTEMVLMRGNYKVNVSYEKFRELVRTSKYDITTKIPR